MILHVFTLCKEHIIIKITAVVPMISPVVMILNALKVFRMICTLVRNLLHAQLVQSVH